MVFLQLKILNPSPDSIDFVSLVSSLPIRAVFLNMEELASVELARGVQAA